MIILTLRTDKPEAEIGLFDDVNELSYVTWQAHRELAETIHLKVDTILTDNALTLKKLDGIVVYKGPGSFTGLRIGIAVANALADSLGLPIVSDTGDGWASIGRERLTASETEGIVQPEYGAEPHITQQKR